MNQLDSSNFSSVDTLMSAAIVSIMTVGCAVLVASQGIQAFVA